MNQMHCYSVPCEAQPFVWILVGIIIGIGIALIFMSNLR